jgi:hypothetical protein
MSQLLRPVASTPGIPRTPGGAIVRAASPGGLVPAPGGAAVPWVQRITTGIARGVAGAGIPGAAIALPAAVGAATLPWVMKNWRGGPGAESMQERRGTTPPAAAARKPYYGPAYGQPQEGTRVGGGNAGASTARQWNQAAPATGGPSPAGSAPGARTTAIRGNFSGGSRMANAIQNAAAGTRTNGLGVAAPPSPPPSPWGPGVAEFDAAASAGAAAAAARSAQGGRGYLSAGAPGAQPSGAPMDFNTALSASPSPSAAQGVDWAKMSASPEVLSAPAQPIGADFGQTAVPATQGVDLSRTGFNLPSGANSGALPDTSNPASQAYWNRADIRAWAGANQGLANDLRKRHGLPALTAPQASPGAAPAGATWTADQAVLAAQSAGALGGLRPGATTADAILAGQGAGAFDRGIPGPQGLPAAPIAPAVAPAGQDPAARMAPAQMPSTGDTAFDPAQTMLRGHLNKISQGQYTVQQFDPQSYNPWSNPELLNRQLF